MRPDRSSAAAASGLELADGPGMHRVTPLLVALFGLALSACDGTPENPSDSCDPPSDPAEFEVGTGEECFERLDAGGAIPLMNGPQGGYHLFVAVGCADCPEEVRISYGARDPQTGEALAGTYESEEVKELGGDDWHQTAGIQLSMPGLSWDETSDPPPAKGTPLVLWAEAKDKSGSSIHTAEIALTIGATVQWDPCEGDGNSEACTDQF